MSYFLCIFLNNNFYFRVYTFLVRGIMPSLQCSVSGCYKSTESKHRFPNPAKSSKTIFNKWVNLCGNKRLKEAMAPEKIFTNCRVCALHFLPEDFGPNKVLKKGVCPSVNLPGKFTIITYLN